MRKKKRIIALLLVLVLATALLSPVAAAKGFSDTRGHWGEKAINRWVELGHRKARDKSVKGEQSRNGNSDD